MYKPDPNQNKPEDIPERAAAASPVVTAAPHPETEQKASPGEKWYNRLVYQGLNYWANLTISLTSADYFTHRSGRRHLDKLIGVTENMLLKSGVSSAHAHRSARSAWEVMALTAGGWIAALSTKPLEDNKRPIVHWLNRQLGVDQTAPDGHQLTADEIFIEREQPHQSWFNIIKRRLMATVAVIGIGHGIEYSIGKKQLTDAIVDNVNATLKSGYIPGGKKLVNNATFERYLGFASLDTIFTGAHAVVMGATNGAKKAHMPKEVHEHAPEGIAKLNEIALAPPAEQEPERSFVSRLPAREEKPLIEPKESHTSAVRRTDGNLSIAT